MKISRSMILPYSSKQMYDVVADIRSYPGFLNWCDRTEIISETQQEVVAKLVISYSKLNMEFTTRNENKIGQSIKLNLVDGPFTNLGGQWQFTELNNEACKVSFDMRFDFDRSLVRRVMDRIFVTIINSQLEAFEQRAAQLYGGATNNA